jgi:hypothetical protein
MRIWGLPGRRFAVATVLIGGVSCAEGSDSRTTGVLTLGDDGGSSGDVADDDGGTTATPTSGVDDTGDGSGGDSSGGTIEPPDLFDGTWMFENVSSSSPMSLHPVRTVIDDGTEIVAWAETDVDSLSVLNIHGARLKDGGWVTTPLTSSDTQDTYPSIVGGPVAHLVWTGQAAGQMDRDLFFATSDMTGWSDPRNLTDAFDEVEPTNETQPAIGRRSNGELFVVFISGPPPVMGFADPPGVFVVELTVDNDPSGQQQVVSPLQANCSDVAAAVAGDDAGHAVASCAGELIHITDRSGDWNDDTLAGTTSGILSPDLGTGGDGEVHLVWIQDTPCGDDQCGDVYYAQTSDGVFGTPVQVTDSANLEERMPTVGVDMWGRVVVVSQARVDNIGHLYLSVSEDGGHTFAPAERISPDGTADDYQTPRGVFFDGFGHPSFAYEHVLDGSDPLNLEIEVARFVPN